MVDKQYNEGSEELHSFRVTSEDVSDDERIPHDSFSEKSEEEKRETWSGQFEFLLSVMGYTVGLGNIWRFPYLCLRNGGGAFLIPFFLFLIICGGPLYYLEVCLGQFSGKSPIIIWEICPLFKGIGAMMVFVSAVCLWYFGIVFAWSIYFLVCSFFPTLGWSTCNNWWNTPLCIDTQRDLNTVLAEIKNGTLNVSLPVGYNDSTTNVSLTASSLGLRSSGTEFWLFNVLRYSDGIDNLGSIQWHLVAALFAGWLMTFLCLAKGVKTVGKVVYVTATAPFILLTILFIRGVTLDGALDGLKLYVTPDFDRLKSGQVWMEAAIQVFYSLGPAWGGVITMASFNKFNHKCFRDTVLVCFSDAFTAFFGGLVVFSVLGFMSKEMGTPLTELAKSGPGLAFIAYPEALSRLPLPQLWSVLFFLTLLFIGIDTQFGAFETCTNAVIDTFYDKLHKRKMYISVSVAILLFLTGLPLATQGGYYIFLLADWYTAAFTIFFTGFLEVVIIAWIYGAFRYSQDIRSMTGSLPSIATRLSWGILLPIMMLSMLIMALMNYQPPSYGKGGYVFPAYAIVIGNIIAIFPMVMLVAIAFLQFLRQKGGFLQRLRTLLKSGEDWLPNDNKQREIYQLNPYIYEKTPLRRIIIDMFGFKKKL